MNDVSYNSQTTIYSNGHQQKPTMLDCPLRFRGEYDWAEIEKFIDYVKTYKNLKNISDEQCFAEFPYLLDGHAYSWYQLRTEHFQRVGFKNMLNILREHFFTRRIPYELYMELYQPYTENNGQSLLEFMMMKLEIFAQLPLPQQPVDSVKIDMIYGLLPRNIQTVMPRGELYDVQEFISRLRNVCDCCATTPAEDQQSTLTKSSQTDIFSAHENKQFGAESELTVTIDGPSDKFSINCNSIDEVCGVECEATKSMLNNRDDCIADVTQPLSANGKNDIACEQLVTESVDVTNVKTEADFAIDSEIIEQINDIIEDCDMYEEFTKIHAQAASQQTELGLKEAMQQKTPLEKAKLDTPSTPKQSTPKRKIRKQKKFHDAKKIVMAPKSKTKRPNILDVSSHKHSIVIRNIFTRSIEPYNNKLLKKFKNQLPQQRTPIRRESIFPLSTSSQSRQNASANSARIANGTGNAVKNQAYKIVTANQPGASVTQSNSCDAADLLSIPVVKNALCQSKSHSPRLRRNLKAASNLTYQQNPSTT